MSLFDINASLYRQRQEAERNARLQGMARAWDMYEGRHTRPLLVTPGLADDNVLINLCRPIVDRGIAFLFGKGVTWQVDETGSTDTPVEKYLAKVYKANKRDLLLHKIAQNGFVTGHAFVKINPQLNGQLPRLINLDPASVEMRWSPDDIDDVTHYTIEYTSAGPDGNELQCRQVISRDGDLGSHWTIQNFERRPPRPWQQVGLDVVWSYPWPPIVHCQNLPSANSVWGDSDLEDAALNDALNRIASVTNKIIRLHGHPRTWGKGFSAKSLERWGVQDLWTIPDKDGSIQNLEMQSDLAANREFYKELRQALYNSARMPDVTAFEGTLGAMTNFGLRILFADLLEKTAVKQLLYGGLIEELNRRLAELGGFGPDVETTLSWPDPLPVDMGGKTNEITAKKASGLVSDETLTAELGYDYADEQERLDAEKQARAAANPAPPPPSDPTTGTGDPAAPDGQMLPDATDPSMKMPPQ